jgi:hypothetical protein
VKVDPLPAGTLKVTWVAVILGDGTVEANADEERTTVMPTSTASRSADLRMWCRDGLLVPTGVDDNRSIVVGVMSCLMYRSPPLSKVLLSGPEEMVLCVACNARVLDDEEVRVRRL